MPYRYILQQGAEFCASLLLNKTNKKIHTEIFDYNVLFVASIGTATQ